MFLTPVRDVLSDFRRAWSLRLPFLAAHIAVSLASFAIVSPLAVALVHGAIGLSGQAALSDMDIVSFLITPVGLICLIVLLSVLITGAVFGIAVMMSIELADRGGRAMGPMRALAWFAGRAPAVLAFSMRLSAFIVLISAPFLLAAALAAQTWLAEFDINYYLTARPPDFYFAAAAICVLLTALAAVLLNRLSAWALALPGLLFASFPASAALRESARLTRGRRTDLIAKLALWASIGAALELAGIAAFGWLGDAVLPLAGGDLVHVATLLALLLLAWAATNLIVSAFVAGALAGLLVRALEEAGAQVVAPASRVGPCDRVRPVLALAGAVVLGVGGAYLLIGEVQTKDAVEIIAHRGATGSRPENTMASVRKAVEDRADWIEIDVQEISDGQVVVVHDQDFMKLAGVDLKIRDATMVDIAEIDIGSWFAPEYADQRAPTLRAVLEEPRGPSRVLVELKYYGHDIDLEARTIRIVEETGSVNETAFMSLKYEAVRKLKALRPDWRIGLLAATAIGDLTGLEADFFAVSKNLVSSNLVQRAQARGRDLYVWTVNDPLEMSYMISLGVDGLITDEPALAREVLEVRRKLSTPGRLLLAAADRLGIDINSVKRTYRDDSP